MNREKDPNVLILIDGVQHNPILWDKLHPDFNDWPKKMATWSSLARICGFQDGNSAIKRFKTLKNARRNFKRSQSNGTSSGVRNYLYEKEMSFLDDGGEQAESYSLHDNSPSADNGGNLEHDLSGLFGQKVEYQINELEDVDEPQTSRNVNYRKRPYQHYEPVNTQETLNRFLSAVDSIGGNESKIDETEGFLFGKIVGQRLDRLDPKKRAQAQMDIQKVLFTHEFDE